MTDSGSPSPPGTGHTGLVDPADHGHLGVDISEVVVAPAASAEAIEFLVNRLPKLVP